MNRYTIELDKRVYRAWLNTNSRILERILTKMHHTLNPSDVLHDLSMLQEKKK